MASPSGIRAGAAYVEIAGDDAPLRSTLGMSRAAMAQYANSIKADLGGAGGFFDQSMTSMVRGSLRLAGWGLAITAAMKMAQAGFAAARGDVDKLDESMKRLPVGVGSLYESLRDVVGELGGFTSRIEGLKKATADLKGFMQELDTLAQTRRNWQFETSLIGMSDVDKKLAEIREKARAEQERIREEAGKKGLGTASESVAEAVGAVNKWAEQEENKVRLEAEKKQTAERLDYLDRLRNLKETAAKEDAALAGRIADETERREKAKADLIRELAKRVFDATHDGRERELHDLDLYYEEKYAKAEGDWDHLMEIQKAWEIETAALMDRQREVEEAGFGPRMVQEAAAAMPEAVARAIIGVRGTFAAGEASRMGYGGASDRMVIAVEQSAKSLKEIEAAARLGVCFT